MADDLEVGSIRIDEEGAEALIKFVDLLKRVNELGLLDTLSDLLSEDVIGGLARLLVNTGSLKALDNADRLVSLLSRVDYDSLDRMGDLIAAFSSAVGEESKPIGLIGLATSLRDPDIRRGLGFTLNILKAVGRSLREDSKG